MTLTQIKKRTLFVTVAETKRQIKELANNGVDNLDGISRMTGACSGCGACDASILELLTENIADYGV